MKKEHQLFLVDRTTNEVFVLNTDGGEIATLNIAEAIGKDIYRLVFNDTSAYERYETSIRNIPVKLKPSPNVFLNMGGDLYLGIEIPYTYREIADSANEEFGIKKGEVVDYIDRDQVFFLIDDSLHLHFDRMVNIDKFILPNKRYANFIYPPFFSNDTLFASALDWEDHQIEFLSYVGFQLVQEHANVSSLTEYKLSPQFQSFISTNGKMNYEFVDNKLLFKFYPGYFDLSIHDFVPFGLNLLAPDEYYLLDYLVDGNVMKILYGKGTTLHCAAYDTKSHKLMLDFSIKGIRKLFTNYYQTDPLLLDKNTIGFINSDQQFCTIELSE